MDITVGRPCPLAWFHAGAGPGVPLLFVHADLGTHRQWSPVMQAFAGDHRVFAFDRRGHGDSPELRGGHGYEAECGDLDAVRAAAGLERFVCVAHSGGAAVAFMYAHAHPERVTGLFLVEPAQSGHAMSRQQAQQTLASVRRAPHDGAAAFYASMAGDDPDVAGTVVDDVRRTNPATIVRVTEALRDFDPAAVPRRFAGPALVVQDSHSDTTFSLARIAGMRQVPVEGVGHWIQLAQPETVEALLRQFLLTLGD